MRTDIFLEVVGSFDFHSFDDLTDGDENSQRVTFIKMGLVYVSSSDVCHSKSYYSQASRRLTEAFAAIENVQLADSFPDIQNIRV